MEEGRVAILAMTVLSAEIVLVVLARRGSPRFLANGLALLGALYCALSERGALIVIACLALGLPAHLMWLSRELRWFLMRDRQFPWGRIRVAAAL